MISKDYTNSFILRSLRLPVITNLQTLSNELAISRQTLFLMSFKTNIFYYEFSIKKKNGTERRISSPNYALKLTQRWILKEILEKIALSEYATGYISGKGHGIKVNANRHRYNLFILEMDLENFFPSISETRVFYLFKNIGYSNRVSKIFSKLCSLNGELPQGAVTSPYISNIIASNLDKRLGSLCGKRDITYSRYADDLTFSCDNITNLLKVISLINDIIESEGFKVNKSKTRLLTPGGHKSVTGITVNDSHIKVNKEFKRVVRSQIHHMIIGMDYSNLNSVKGMISYINSIEPDYIDKIRKYVLSFYQKDIACIKAAVDSFNTNKIFSDLEDMIELPVSKFCDDRNHYDEYFQDLNMAHQEYLESRLKD